MKRPLLAVLGTMLCQSAYAQLSSLSLYEYEWSDHSSMFGMDGEKYQTTPPLTFYPRFQGWTQKMVNGYIEYHEELIKGLDSLKKQKWADFKDSIQQRGRGLFPRYSDKADTLYDAPYAAKLEAIRQMIGEDVYFMLGAVKPGNRLWIVRFKPRRIWANERWAVSGPTVVIGSEEDVKKAEDLKVLK